MAHAGEISLASVGPHPQRDQLFVSRERLQPFPGGPEDAGDVTRQQVQPGELRGRRRDEEDQRRGDAFSVRPEVRRAGEGHVAHQAESAAQDVDGIGGCSGGRPSYAIRQHLCVRDDAGMQWQFLRQSSSDPFLALRRRQQSGERAAGVADDVGKGGVANVRLPQCRAGSAPRRMFAMLTHPDHQLHRLRPLEVRGALSFVHDLHWTEHAHHQGPIDGRRHLSGRCNDPFGVRRLTILRLHDNQICLVHQQLELPEFALPHTDRHHLETKRLHDPALILLGEDPGRTLNRSAHDDTHALAGGRSSAQVAVFDVEHGRLFLRTSDGCHDRRLPGFATRLPAAQHEGREAGGEASCAADSS